MFPNSNITFLLRYGKSLELAIYQEVRLASFFESRTTLPASEASREWITPLV